MPGSDFNVEKLLEDISLDEKTIRELRALDNTPAGLIERVLIECKTYTRGGFHDQYVGVYRGHKFLIGWETVKVKENPESMLLAMFGMSAQAGKRTKKRMVFCIASKPGGFATSGLRYTDEFEGPLRVALHKLYEVAEQLYEESEIERLMDAPKEVQFNNMNKYIRDIR